MLTQAECVKVTDLVAKGKSARAIVLSSGVGKMQFPRHSCQEDIDSPILEGRHEQQNAITRCKKEREWQPKAAHL